MPGVLAAIADPAVRGALREWLVRTADDELVIGHRHSEWTGFGPDIESDVAMSSIAQEEIGHARVLYELIAADERSDVDHLAFGRTPAEYRHAAFLEQENGGWEQAIVRLALYEPFEAGRLSLLAACGHEPVAALARTLAREERYHGLFAQTWLERLARTAREGRDRVQAAVDAAWPDALGLFEDTPADGVLQGAGLLTEAPVAQQAAWEDAVRETLTAYGLAIPPGGGGPRRRIPGLQQAPAGGRRGAHTPAFDRMLAEMTEVWRSDPEARW